MVKTNKSGAVAGLTDLLSALPSDHDARSEFFLSWKKRTITTLELIFPDDPQPVQQFKEVEFSPRRLTNDDVRDSQLKLDAYLAGCAAARTLLESLLWRLSSADKAAAPDAPSTPTPARASIPVEPAAPRAAPQAPAPPQRTTDPWVIMDPANAPDLEPASKPIMASNVVLLPPHPVQVEAALKREKEKADKEKAQREKVERERLEREKAELEKIEREKAQLERAQLEKAELEKAEREKAELQKAAREKARREKEERERLERDKAEQEAEEKQEAQRRAAQQHEHRQAADREKGRRAKARRQAQPESPVIAGATMETRDLCSPVRGSLARMLGAWEKGDRDTAAVASAQLLADLSVLAHHDRFKAAFETVVTRAFAPDEAQRAVDALNSTTPLCVWSMIAAINEVMKS